MADGDQCREVIDIISPHHLEANYNSLFSAASYSCNSNVPKERAEDGFFRSVGEEADGYTHVSTVLF